MFKRFTCKLFKHRIDRRRVWNDGIDYRTACARCAAPLLRDPAGWREFDLRRDAHEYRKPHPRAGD